MQGRFPFAPLEAAISQGRLPGTVAQVLGVTKRTVFRYRHDGLSTRQADHLAIRAGLHPGSVWTTWVDDTTQPVHAAAQPTGGHEVGGVKVVGLDLSLTATGYCAPDGTTETISSKQRGMDRIEAICNQVMVRTFPADQHRAGPDLVVIEDYAFSRGGHAHEIGELGGVVKRTLRNFCQPYVLIGPSSLKKFATGKGNANKIEMGVAAARAGQDFAGDDNQCDAWWLRTMALYRYGIREAVAETAYRDDAVSKVTWPEIGEQVCASG